jgi:hypothetical protein
MNQNLEEQLKLANLRNQKCKFCWGRGVIALVAGREDDKDIIDVQPCACVQRKIKKIETAERRKKDD